jgi:hypothetical protein
MWRPSQDGDLIETGTLRVHTKVQNAIFGSRPDLRYELIGGSSVDGCDARAAGSTSKRWLAGLGGLLFLLGCGIEGHN